MDLALTARQEDVRRTARELAAQELAPLAAKLDEEHRFPAEGLRRLASLGFLGITVPEAQGGAGLDQVAYVLAVEEIARACAGTALIMSVQSALVCDPLVTFGTAAQRREWLAPLARGDCLGCFALSEPGAGSDAGALSTVARREGDGFVVSGTKSFVTNAPVARVAVLFAMTDPARGAHGITAFLVPLDAPGVTLGPRDRKLGVRAAQSCRVVLEEVRLPASAVLGEVGMGFRIAMQALDGGRIGLAALAVGIARACLEDSLAYARERRTFGKPIATHQAIQWKLADMATEADAAHLLTLRAAARKDRGERHTVEAAMAKLLASEVANRAAREAVQVYGGYGCLADYPVERHFRDAKSTEIDEGTSEIQRIVIAQGVIGE